MFAVFMCMALLPARTQFACSLHSTHSFAAHCSCSLPAVYAKDLQFLPMGSEIPDETGCRFAVGQQHMLPEGVQPVYDDILVAKMRPGQVIQLEAHCIKGDFLSHA